MQVVRKNTWEMILPSPVREADELKVNAYSKPGLEITERSKDSIPRVLMWELREQSILYAG